MTRTSEFPQTQFGKDLGACIAYLMTVYERLALLYRHVKSRLGERGWTEWPAKSKMTETSASLDWPRWWLLSYAVRSYIKGQSESTGSERPTQVLAVGVQLVGDEESFEPLAHGLVFNFDHPLERGAWDSTWFRHLMELGPRELLLREIQTPLYLLRRFEPRDKAQGWAPMTLVESFSFPLARLDSDRDVQELLIEPLIVLSEGGLDQLQRLAQPVAPPVDKV